MNHLTRNDYAGAMHLLAQLESRTGDLPGFVAAALVAVGGWVASELATLSVCDRVTGRCQVAGLSGQRLGAEDIAVFDRRFFEHSPVRYHGIECNPDMLRIPDALGGRHFRRAPLHAEYCLPVGSEHATAMPLFADSHTLVSIVLNRHGIDFSARDRERLELLRPHIAFLYRQVCGAHAELPVASALATAPMPLQPEPRPADLTLRECEVMHWLARGKTDADIAALLSISPRTVQKHLEHVYVKLGVETRTAAVMRALQMRPSDGRAGLEGIGPIARATREAAAHTPG